MLRSFVFLPLLAAAAFSQSYTGPKPPKPDVVYLLHADTLVETEAAEAKEEHGKKDDITYVVGGAASSAKTPMASPIFIVLADKMNAERLQLYRLEVRNGRREITFSQRKRNNPRPLTLTVNSVGNNIYRIEADTALANGEYSLTPEGSNQVFCFAVY